MISRKCAVLGLGNFGRQVALSLAELGHDVLAMDLNPYAVEAVSSRVSRAVVADASSKEGLIEAGASGVDIAVVGVGTRIDASTLATLHLRELGVKSVIAKAVTDDHAKVLAKVGATEIVQPERDMAKKLAAQLKYPYIMEELPLFEGYALFKIKSPESLWGKSIAESDLRHKNGIAVVAVERDVGGKATQSAARPDHKITSEDTLIVLTSPDDIRTFNNLK